MKRVLFLVLVAVLAVSLVACTKNGKGESTYKSSDGWKVNYEKDLFDVKENGDGTVVFAYKGESGANDTVTFSYVKDKMPEEALYEKVQDIDDSRIQRGEGYFGGDNEWAFSRAVAPAEGSSENRVIFGTEHNGGTLLVDVVSNVRENDDKDMKVSDDIAALLDGLTYTKHQAQTQFAYVPGEYVREYTEEIEGSDTKVTETITLKDDHSGTMSFQDDVDIIWTSTELVEVTSDKRYEYTVEGDSIMVKLFGDEWTQFDKKK